MTINRVGAIFSVLFAAFGAYVIIESLRFGLTSPIGPGSGLFPFISGVLIFAGAAINLFQTVKNHEKGEIYDWNELLPIGAIIAISTIFVSLSETVGVFILMPVLFVSVSLVIRRPRTLNGYGYLVAGSSVFSLAAYLVFNRLFGMSIPVAWFV